MIERQYAEDRIRTEEETLVCWDDMLLVEHGADYCAHLLLVDWLDLDDIKECISDDPSAKSAMEKLKRAGCEEEFLLKCLSFYCDDPDDTSDPGGLSWRRDEMLKTAERLQQLSDDVVRCLLDIRKCGIRLDLRPPGEVEQLASTLRRLPKHYRERSRDLYLFAIGEMIQRVSKRDYYEEIAHLIAATLRKFNPNDTRSVDAQSVRKSMDSCREKMPHSARTKLAAKLEGPEEEPLPLD